MTAAHSRANRREAQQLATQEAIAVAAERLFRDDGYVATTVGAIAREAGTAIQTVYNAVGSKAAVLSAVLDRTAAGTEGRPVLEFLAQRLAAAPDSPALIGVLADWFAEANPRTLPIHRVITQAAAVDREIADLQALRAQQRLERYRRTEPLLRERGGFRSGLSAEDVAATVWSIGSPATYEALVVQSGWSLEVYRDWVARTLGAALLTSDATR